MIKAIELGTGNLIMIDDKHTSYITGTPLTPEWLKRCGFKQSPPSSIGDLYLDLPDNNELEYSYVDKLITFNGMVLPKSPEHVHELQNLYLALTGEELTIKEKI